MAKELEKYGDLMKILHEKARKESREFGFLFCEKDRKLFPSMTTTGGRRAMEKIVDCEMFEGKAKGSFHTHPSDLGLSFPAPSDVCYSFLSDHDFLCVSGEIPRRVACWKIWKEKAAEPCKRLAEAKTATEASEADSEIRKKLDEMLEQIYVKRLPVERR